jgi:hypothetical protein
MLGLLTACEMGLISVTKTLGRLIGVVLEVIAGTWSSLLFFHFYTLSCIPRISHLSSQFGCLLDYNFLGTFLNNYASFYHIKSRVFDIYSQGRYNVLVSNT